jgi:hypothetical protein
MPLLGEALHQAPSDQAMSPGGQIPRGALPASCCPQSPSDFLRVSSHVGFVARRSKNKVADPQTGSLETRALVCILLKLATICPTTPAWGMSMGKWPIMEWVAKDTTAQSAKNYESTMV